MSNNGKESKNGFTVFIFSVLLSISIIGCAQPKMEPNIMTLSKINNASLEGEYDPDNLLARTSRGDIPSAKLYEDENVLAFLGERPFAPGHFVVISKNSKARNFIEMDLEDLCHILAVTRIVAEAEITAIGVEGFTLYQNNGSASSIHQFHLHVIPRWKGDRLNLVPQSEVSVSELEQMAEKIRAVLSK